MRSSELERIARIARAFERPSAGVEVAIGDDAAVLALPARAGAWSEKLVWTVDAQVEGVHFRRDLVSMHDIGFRSFMAAASDVAAMGATPWCALSSLVLPASLEDEALDALIAGQREAADAIDAGVVGGNLARGSELGITTTLLGKAASPLARRGALPGDKLLVAGSLGLAAAGLRALEAETEDPRCATAIAAWRRPRARIAEGLRAARVARACIDVSDGLAQDVAHVAAASGVAVLLDAQALRAHGGEALAGAAQAVGADPLALMLHGGEDYALVIASAAAVEGFVQIGEIVEGTGVALRENGRTTPIEARGWDHFRPR